MSRLLLVADEPWVVNEVRASLTDPDDELIDVADPRTAAAAAYDRLVDAVIVDLQVGSMGGMAVTRAVRDMATERGERPIPVVILLDRSADVFLARRAGAAAWLTKPMTCQQLRMALSQAFASEGGHLELVGSQDENPSIEVSADPEPSAETALPATAADVE